MEESQLDDVIERLLEVRQSRPGKQVQLTEQEIRHLCLTAKEIFMSQPNLLELEAPIKICGAFTAPPGGLQQRGGSRPGLSLRPESPAQAISTGSTPTCCGCSSTGASRRRRTTSSWGTTLTEASRAWRQSASCSRTRCGPARAPGQAGARRAGAPHACGPGGRAAARREQPASGRAGPARAALRRACPLAGGLALAAPQSPSVRARAARERRMRRKPAGVWTAGPYRSQQRRVKQAARGGKSWARGAVACARPRRGTTGRWVQRRALWRQVRCARQEGAAWRCGAPGGRA